MGLGLEYYGLMRERNGGGIELGDKDGVWDAAATLATTAGQNDVVLVGMGLG